VTAVPDAVERSGDARPGDAIVLQDVRKSYGGREVLAGVSFTVARGELFALLGPNGAGKTTTVELIEGYRQTDAGDLRVLGLDPGRDGTRLHPRLGLMLQDGGIDPRTTPHEALRLYASLYRRPVSADRLLELAGLATVATTRYRRLSGGERQRLGLALALVGRPELVILDEPTAGMDPAAKAATRELIVGLRSAGMTILLTTHDLADVERLADRVALLDRGRIVALGSPAELTAGSVPRLRFRVAVRLTDAVLRDLEARLLEAADTSHDALRLREEDASGGYVIEGAVPTPALVAALAAACAEHGTLLVELRATGATLEERYLELVGRSAADEPDRERGLRL
jgi:ABC-2 type transport system ATP-binding protein